jgi:WD40 repeat protein
VVIEGLKNLRCVKILQIWNLGSPEPNFTLDAHLKGVNCLDYYSGGDRPYLITGSDDQTAKVRNLPVLNLVVLGG